MVGSSALCPPVDGHPRNGSSSVFPTPLSPRIRAPSTTPCSCGARTLVRAADDEGPDLANIKSQKKRILTNEKARQRNVAVKSELKTAIRAVDKAVAAGEAEACLLYTSPSPRDRTRSRMPSSA